jgi:hypothetical protein
LLNQLHFHKHHFESWREREKKGNAICIWIVFLIRLFIPPQKIRIHWYCTSQWFLNENDNISSLFTITKYPWQHVSVNVNFKKKCQQIV